MAGTSPSGRRYEFDAALAARKLEQQGGFSMQRTSGKEPTRGYMVSDWGKEKVIPGNASAHEIDTFRQENPNKVSRGRRYVGGWAEGGQTYLDVSRNFHDRRKAITAGQENAQYGIYDLKKDRSINPFGGMKMRGTLFEDMSRNERKRFSTSNANLRVEKARQVKETTAPKAKRSRPLSRQQKLPGI